MKQYVIFISLLLGACSNLPVAIKNPPLYDISYSQVSQKPADFKNTPVRWGGTVIDVENDQNFTLVQVLSYPLYGNGEPQTREASQGRFVIKSAEFLDPAVYTKDTEITVAGTLLGDIERSVGKKTMRLPLISPSTIYLWPVYVHDNYYDSIGYGYNPYYGAYPYYRGLYSSPFMYPGFPLR